MAETPTPDEHAEHHEHAGHPEHLAHHFESPRQQLESARLGMWIFIATEILFFGGLLCAYAVYRSNHPEIFVWAHHFLDKSLGALNTIILICSSLTAAWAVRAAQLRQRRMLIGMLALTLVFATAFLGVKYTEYSHKWKHGLLWASRFDPHLETGHEPSAPADEAAADPGDPEPPAAETAETQPQERSALPPAATGPPGLADPAADASTSSAAPDQHAEAPHNARVFFSIYFLLTGLHGIHVLGGMAAMLWLLLRILRGQLTDGYFTPVDMVALYWHLVDLIWIYLFLLLYLIH
jgi:cytochrome c oxidase subunit 3